MAVIWDVGQPCSIRSVWECLEAAHGVTFSTIQTVMNRLTEKRFLQRTGRRAHYLYAATAGREEVRAQISRRLVEGLVSEFGEQAVCQFVEVAGRTDPRLVRRLADEVSAWVRRVRPTD